MSLNKLQSILLKLVALIVLAIAGVWIAGIIVSQWYRLETSGAFVKWKLLDGPHRFQEIFNVYDFDLRAQADDGKIYSYKTEWKEWQPDPTVFDTRSVSISTNCESLYGFTTLVSRDPPTEAGALLQCGIAESRHPLVGTVDIAYYVLSEDGEIWMWRHTRDPQQEIVISLAGLFAGLVAGIIVWFLVQDRL